MGTAGAKAFGDMLLVNKTLQYAYQANQAKVRLLDESCLPGDEWCYQANVRLLDHKKHDLPELFSLEVNSEGLLILQKKSKVRCGRWPEPVDHLARRGGSLCSTGGGWFVSPDLSARWQWRGSRALLRLVATFY